MKRTGLLVACTVALLAAAPMDSPAASDEAGTQAVRCQLPPQIRRLGRQATYLAAGRIISTTAAECRVRGGQGRAAAAAAPPDAASEGGMGVMVGGERDTAACPVSGEIIGLKGRSTLSVRAGPGTQHARLDRLANGRRVFVCDGSSDEAWLGIVYPRAAGQDCGVEKPLRDARAYAGPCPVGWVNAGWVHTDADLTCEPMPGEADGHFVCEDPGSFKRCEEIKAAKGKVRVEGTGQETAVLMCVQGG